MFSANENLMLREHKRRVVRFIEETIPEEALDFGTSVMVMQTVCKTPGCVPLETSVIIVFPKDGKEHIDGLPESCGGTFKTKILLPLSEVTKDDVLDALPPSFKGGRKTMENLCLAMRDFVLGRIGGTLGTGESTSEKDDRRLIAEYLIMSLNDYVQNECVAPELGKAFSDKSDNETGTQNINGNASFKEEGQAISTDLDERQTKATAIDWKRKQNFSKQINSMNSNNIIQELSSREHHCLRTLSCPCCESGLSFKEYNDL